MRRAITKSPRQPALALLLVQLLPGTVMAVPNPGPPPQTTCPAVVRDFLENVGLLPDPLPWPAIVIDLDGRLVDCLPPVAPRDVMLEAAKISDVTSRLHELHAQSDEHVARYGRTCLVSNGVLPGVGPFKTVIVSYDLAEMTNPACLQRAKQSLSMPFLQ